LSHLNLTSGQAAEPSSGTHHATEKPGAAQSAISLHASREQPPAPGRSDSLTAHPRPLLRRAGVGLELAREAMEMPWANWRGLSQAIPPAFTEYLGHYLLSHVQPERIAA
jgi:hypothetical protein